MRENRIHCNITLLVSKFNLGLKMPLDHYVPQVHLSKWLSADIGRLRAIRKSDLKSFTPGSKGVCAIRGGSTNRYLEDNRKIEEFLKEFEPKYNIAVANISKGKVDYDSIRTIAGLVSCISSCSPTAMRLHTPFLKEVVSSTGRILDRKGMIPKLRGHGLPALLDSGIADIQIDGKYPVAFSIQNIESTTITLANCKWDIVINKFNESPFFTSDYPIALEPSKQYRDINNKIVPLSPEVAVRIRPFPSVKTAIPGSPTLTKMCEASRKEVEYINRLIVRSAEDLVFYQNEHDWIAKFVERNRCFRIEGLVFKTPMPGGYALINQQRIVWFDPANQKKEASPTGDNWFEVTPAEKE
ncbi:MAG: DUF4238 domain-containing protein [Cryomorphaceae bacterium]|nr:DUF4238 domain-containing protein [Cryomorphaceae bacterium]